MRVVAQIAPYLKAGSTLSDVGSVKKAVIDAVEPLVPANVHFVPAHPLAGTEHSGPESGFSTLFDNRWCILVPTSSSVPSAVEQLTSFGLVWGHWSIIWMLIITIWY